MLKKLENFEVPLLGLVFHHPEEIQNQVLSQLPEVLRLELAISYWGSLPKLAVVLLEVAPHSGMDNHCSIESEDLGEKIITHA